MLNAHQLNMFMKIGGRFWVCGSMSRFAPPLVFYCVMICSMLGNLLRAGQSEPSNLSLPFRDELFGNQEDGDLRHGLNPTTPYLVEVKSHKYACEK